MEMLKLPRLVSFGWQEILKIIFTSCIIYDMTKLTKASEIRNEEVTMHLKKTENYHGEITRSKRDVPGNGHTDVTALLDDLLHEENYDRRHRPNIGGKPVEVEVGLWVIALDSINVIDMDFKMDFFLRQLWVDPRLAHMHNTTYTISNQILNRIWIPDTYFVNSKESKFHKVTVENKLLEIGKHGRVHFNTRVSVKPSCHMDLRMFPNDEQKCYLDIESYSYNQEEVILVWENRSDGGLAIPIRDLPQHNITKTLTIPLHTQYSSGNWSGIRAEITIKRKMGYFLVHVYSPSALIVVLSWISFCIPLESTAARVTLGITSILTTTTILNILNNSMPKVSYVKAIDWYLICCFLFVFGVLVEYTIVLYLDNYCQRKRKQTQVKEKLEREAKAKEAAKRPFNEGETKKKSTYAKVRQNNEVCTYVHGDDKPKKTPLFPRIKKYFQSLSVRDIDEIARICFPLTFMLFNAVYWLVFLS